MESAVPYSSSILTVGLKIFSCKEFVCNIAVLKNYLSFPKSGPHE